MPRNWIYFGAVHAYCLLVLLSLPFRSSPRLAGVVGAALLACNALDLPYPLNVNKYPMLWFAHHGADYAHWADGWPFFLLGMFARRALPGQLLARLDDNYRFVQFYGRYAIHLYVLHQAIAFPVIMLLAQAGTCGCDSRRDYGS